VNITFARWVLLGIVASPGLFGGDITFNISLQTNSSFLTTPSYVDFQFTQGDPAEIGSNTAKVSLSNLFPNFILSDGPVPGSGEQIFTFSPGVPISFSVQISSNVTSSTTPDLLAIYVLDSSFNTINTTDPAEVGTLVSFTEPTDPAQDIALGIFDTSNNDFNTSVTIAPAPEPSTFLLSVCFLMVPLFRCGILLRSQSRFSPNRSVRSKRNDAEVFGLIRSEGRLARREKGCGERDAVPVPAQYKAARSAPSALRLGSLPHRLSFHLDVVCVMNRLIENAVRQRRISNLFMPPADR
jgi:hypothetical protein